MRCFWPPTPLAFAGYTQHAVFIEDGEMVVLNADEYRVVNRQNIQIDKSVEGAESGCRQP